MISALGEDRVGARIGPNGRWNGMSDRDPDALFDFVAGMAITPNLRGAISGIEFAQNTAQIQFRLASRLQASVKQQRGPAFGLAVTKTFTE